MYINDDYSNYKYLVSASDNYALLSNSSFVNGSSGDVDTVSAIYNYYSDGSILPTTLYFYDYRKFTDVSSTFTNDYFDLTLSSNYFLCCCFIIILIIFIINNLTKLIKKGGVFGSN